MNKSKYENSQILSLDTRIPSSNQTLRQVVLSLKDQDDGRRIFNSIDLRWDSSTIYVLTFRPDKRCLAYQYSNSLPTYVRYLHPTSDLSHIFTMEAIERTNEETYHPDLQRFTTAEDITKQREIDDDYDDDSMDYVEYPEYSPAPSLPTKTAPLNDRLFDLTGDAETVSTMANDNLSVTFQDSLSQDDLPLPPTSINPHENSSVASNESTPSN